MQCKLISLCALMLLAGCGRQNHDHHSPVVAVTSSKTDPWGFPILDRANKRVGMAFTRLDTRGAFIMLDVAGLPPGQHGVHIHEIAKCESPRFESAGGHWNWTNRKHGHQNPLGHHAGDLGNLTVGQNGRGNTTFLIPVSDWNPAAAGKLPIVIHTAADDERTDPSGNSGDRIACGLLYFRGN